jgi:hypothetical protein
MKPVLITALLLIFFCPLISHGQTYIAHYIERDHIKSDTLTDINTGIKFIVDKERIFVKAIDKNGKQLWKKDPATDDKYSEYRVKRPVIVYFQIVKAPETQANALLVRYNNSQFGCLDEKTGKELSGGQD